MTGRDPGATTAILGLAGILTTIGFVLVSGLGVTPDVIETETALRVSARGWQHEVRYASIDSVTLRRHLDGLQRRLAGEQSGAAYLGRFQMRPYDEVMLFVDANKKPFVVIHAGNTVTMLSSTDSASAVSLAERLAAAAARTTRSDRDHRDSDR